jgi:hypothetical protein
MGDDRLQGLIDFRPAVDAQQNVAAGTPEWQRRVGFSRRNCAHDADARNDCAEVVQCPAHEGAARWEADDAAAATEDFLVGDSSKANPVLDATSRAKSARHASVRFEYHLIARGPMLHRQAAAERAMQRAHAN